jgi:hypothetical protein
MNKGLQGLIKRKQDLSIALQLGLPRAWILASTTGIIYRSWGIRSIVSGGAGACAVNLAWKRGGVAQLTASVTPVTSGGMATVSSALATSFTVTRYNTAGTAADGDFFLVIYAQ